MRRYLRYIVLCVLAALSLSGCAMRTIDQMYCLPKRSEDYNDLQSVVDEAMVGLSYCAPLSGENQQTVQMADLDGDGSTEYLVFAKATQERPLQILIFHQEAGEYRLYRRIESYGATFDQVEYVPMEDSGGVCLVVGSQLSDQVLRSLTVYSFASGQEELLLTTSYTKFLTCDLNEDGCREIMVLRPGQTDTDKGIAELYYMRSGTLERTNEASMSEPADKLKRIVSGKLNSGEQAVYVASTVDENAIITDIFAWLDDVLTNVSFSNESGTSVKTLRNYYVYADDIDDDGVVEIPGLITMKSAQTAQSTDKQYLIRWYAVAADGSEVDKKYTYHNFAGGWYLELDKELAARITVVPAENTYGYYLWDASFSTVRKLLTVYVFTADAWDTAALDQNHILLHKTDSAVYTAVMQTDAANAGITEDKLVESFHMIHKHWKTGET